MLINKHSYHGKIAWLRLRTRRLNHDCLKHHQIILFKIYLIISFGSKEYTSMEKNQRIT